MKFFLFTLFLTFTIFATKGSHLAGGELTFRCIGMGQYEITYTFYRDCGGISENEIRANVSSNSCGYSLMTTLYPLNFPGDQITPHCSQLSTCDGGLVPGIQKIIYSGIILLPAVCDDIIFSAILWSRNSILNTIQEADTCGLYISATENELSSGCDNSPVFTKDPIFFTCVNHQPYCLDPGIYDADGDSLACFLVEPLSDSRHRLSYFPGFSATQPFLSSPPIQIDSHTGILCFTATQPTAAVYVIQINSYRNGILNATVKRDVMIYASNCPGYQPDVYGINGLTNYDTTICVNSNCCFDVYSHDPHPTDSTFISWDQGIANGTFQVSSDMHQIGQFCWTPNPADVSNSPHCFTVNVHDNTCPAPQFNQRQYCITVEDSSDCTALSVPNAYSKKCEFKIYPQPANGIVSFDFGFYFNQNLKLCISNLLGRKIQETNITESILRLQGFLPGIYISYLVDQNGLILEKKKFVVLQQ